jgi:hypothetical protein
MTYQKNILSKPFDQKTCVKTSVGKKTLDQKTASWSSYVL